MTERVVITGLGAITPIGANAHETWGNLVEGRSGIGPITLFDTTDFDARIGGEVKNFQPDELLSAREAKRLDRFCQFALIASREALADSGLVIDESNSEDVGVLMGSGIGGQSIVSVRPALSRAERKTLASSAVAAARSAGS